MNNQEPIEVLSKDYKPWFKFGVSKLLDLVKGKKGTNKEPLVFHIQDPQFGRVLRLLDRSNVASDNVGRFDHHLVSKSRGVNIYIRVFCLGKRKSEQKLYKGANEL